MYVRIRWKYNWKSCTTRNRNNVLYALLECFVKCICVFISKGNWYTYVAIKSNIIKTVLDYGIHYLCQQTVAAVDKIMLVSHGQIAFCARRYCL